MPRSWLLIGVLLGFAQAGAGCAGVRVYSDPSLAHETGVKVFAPKPYLLVARTGAKNAPVQLSIVYLPDTSDVSYIRQQRGWGSNDLGLSVQNGMLVQLGSKSDARAGDTASGVADLLGAAAAAYATTTPRAADNQPAEGTFELYEIRQDRGRTLLVRVSSGG